jgi:hypothetical protein
MPILDRTKIAPRWANDSQWVVWRYELTDTGKLTKVPYSPLYPPTNPRRASSTDPRTWSTLAVCEQACDGTSFFDGLGHMQGEDASVGLDYDHCLDDQGRITEPWVETEVALLDSWTYVTPSGTGLRVIVDGRWPDRGRRTTGLEVYARERFFTVTDQLYQGSTPVINARQFSLDTVYATHFTPPPAVQTQTRYPMGNPWTPGALSDDEAIEHLERFGNAQKFRDLMAGSWEQYYPSIAAAGQGASEADAGLVGIISYVTQDDAQIERIMWRSGLARDKWHESNYLQRTIQTYKRYRTVFYTPPPPRFTRPQRPAPMSNPCPSAPPAPMSNPCPSGDACAARVHELETQLATERAEKEQWVAYALLVEEQRDEAWKQINQDAKIRGNKELGTERETALALLDIVRQKERRGEITPDGRIPIANWEIEQVAPVGRKTVGAHVTLVAEMAGIERDVVKHHGTYVDEITGEIKGAPGEVRSETFYVVDSADDLASRIAASTRESTPERPKPGRKLGDQRPRVCEEHPDSTVELTGELRCSAGGEVLATGVTVVFTAELARCVSLGHQPPVQSTVTIVGTRSDQRSVKPSDDLSEPWQRLLLPTGGVS